MYYMYVCILFKKIKIFCTVIVTVIINIQKNNCKCVHVPGIEYLRTLWALIISNNYRI
jgi:hypothetical protein